MLQILRHLWTNDAGQDVAEYALMLAVVLLIVVASVSAIGTNANTVFNSVASQLTAS
jgi:Flp pilus assembly pilin Flp